MNIYKPWSAIIYDNLYQLSSNLIFFRKCLTNYSFEYSENGTIGSHRVDTQRARCPSASVIAIDETGRYFQIVRWSYRTVWVSAVGRSALRHAAWITRKPGRRVDYNVMAVRDCLFRWRRTFWRSHETNFPRDVTRYYRARRAIAEIV